jgi:di/tricarboxylate transporter
VAIPVFRIIARNLGDKRVTRALALLIPTVILVSTISSIIGAGSHLVANDLLRKMSGQSLSFGTWMLYGGPFGVVASYLSCWAITRLFLDEATLAKRFNVKAAPANGLSFAEKFTLATSAAMMVLWLSEKLHHLEIATVTMAGAMLLTLPKYGVLKWKEALASVSWNLILFVGAALVLGKALIDAGAAQWIINQLFAATNLAALSSTPLVLVMLSLLTLTSHVYMTSHAARAAALVPALLYVGSSLGLNPLAVMFIGTVGMDYCLTFPVSSKALLMFQELDGETWHPKDLLRLSAALIPVHVLLMVLFYFGYWRWIGLSL